MNSLEMSLSGVGFSYGKREVFQNISMTAQAGDIIGILGNNGCGKTTLLKVIGGFLRPKSGIISIIPLQKGVKFSGLLETPHMWENMTGLENLIYYLRHDFEESRAKNLAERFHLADALSKSVKNYSLGMKQKLALIIAFMSSAPVMLLDEPTSSLDQDSIETFFELVSEEAKSGRIIIMVTHIIFELDRYCNRIYLMSQGGLESWEEKFKDQVAELIRFEFETEEGRDKALKLLTVKEVIDVRNREIVLSPTDESVGRIVERISKCGICGVSKIRKTLRDIYREENG